MGGNTGMASGDFLVVTAPAKVNLNLIIKGRRADGYHELETLMTRISLADDLRVELRGSDAGVTLQCDAEGVPNDESNLAVRAARLFFAAAGVAGGCHIELVKRIPAGGGLGGGSSDAAAVLRALNVMHGRALDLEKLSELAAGLGSDVAFFLHDCQSALCTGRGEVITPQPAREDFPRRCFLTHPGFGVPTPWAYKAYAERGQNCEILEAEWANFSRNFPWGVMRNDLQEVVFKKYLWLPAVWEWLMGRCEVEAALMSGTGASVYGILRPGAEEAKLLKDFREIFGATVLAQCCDMGIVL